MSSEMRYMFVPGFGPRQVRKDCCGLCEIVGECWTSAYRCNPPGVPKRGCAECEPCDAFSVPVFVSAATILREGAS